MTPKLAPRATLFTVLFELEIDPSLPESEMFPAMGVDPEGEIDLVKEGTIDPSNEDKGVPVPVPDPAGIEVDERILVPFADVPMDASESVKLLDSEEEDLCLVLVAAGDGAGLASGEILK
jgi:hypothetical protein